MMTDHLSQQSIRSKARCVYAAGAATAAAWPSVLKARRWLSSSIQKLIPTQLPSLPLALPLRSLLSRYHDSVI